MATFIEGTLTRGGGLFRRTVGQGDINMTHTLSKGAGGVYSRTLTRELSVAGLASALFEGPKWLIGTVTWYIKEGDTYLKTLTRDLTFSKLVTRNGIFRRKVLSQRILLETGYDLLLEGGGKLFMEGQKVLSFAGNAYRAAASATVSIAGELGFGRLLDRYARQFRTNERENTPEGNASRWLQWSRTQLGGLSFDVVDSAKYKAIRNLTRAIDIFSGEAVRSSVVLQRLVDASIDFEGILKKAYFVAFGSAIDFAGDAATAVGAIFNRALSRSFDIAGVVLPTASKLKRTIGGAVDYGRALFWEKGSKVYGVLSFVVVDAPRVMFKRTVSRVASLFSGDADRRVHLGKSAEGVLNFRGITRRTAQFIKKGLSRFGFNIKNE